MIDIEKAITFFFSKAAPQDQEKLTGDKLRQLSQQRQNLFASFLRSGDDEDFEPDQFHPRH
jgi:hypothetical protein